MTQVCYDAVYYTMIQRLYLTHCL